MKRRPLLRAVIAGALLAAGLPALGQTGKDTLQLGIAPHTSARVILEMYQPLRAYLEKSLGRRVEVVTAPDFTEFARRGIDQQYDLAVTTGHQARLFQSDAGYLPLLTYRADFKAVVIVGEGSRYKEPKDLAGTTVVGLSPSSLVTIWGQHWLHRNSVPGVTLKYVSAADSAAQLVLNGEGAAAFQSLANYQKLPPAAQGKLRLLAESLPLAGRVYVLNKRHAPDRERIEAALWAFAETPEAKRYFEQNKLDGYRRLEPRELVAMEPYANEVRQVLKEEQPATGKTRR